MFTETTLLFKTILILSGQIGIVFGIAYFLIKRAKYAFENNTKLFGYSFRAAMNMNKELDLVPYIESPSNYPIDMSKTIKKNHFETKLRGSYSHSCISVLHRITWYG